MRSRKWHHSFAIRRIHKSIADAVMQSATLTTEIPLIFDVLQFASNRHTKESHRNGYSFEWNANQSNCNFTKIQDSYSHTYTHTHTTAHLSTFTFTNAASQSPYLVIVYRLYNTRLRNWSDENNNDAFDRWSVTIQQTQSVLVRIFFRF